MVFIHSLFFFFYTLLFVMDIYRFNRDCSSLHQFVLMVYMIVLIMKMETLFCLLCLKFCNCLKLPLTITAQTADLKMLKNKLLWVFNSLSYVLYIILFYLADIFSDFGLKMFAGQWWKKMVGLGVLGTKIHWGTGRATYNVLSTIGASKGALLPCFFGHGGTFRIHQ